MWKKLFSSVLVFVVAVGIVEGTGSAESDRKVESVASGEIVLTDIDGHWAASDIQQAVTKGYVEGYDNGTFKPERSVKRSEFIKMIVSAMALDVEGVTKGNDWYKAYAAAAKEAGIYQDEFGSDQQWNEAITRTEMAKFAVKAAGKDQGQYYYIDFNDPGYMYLATDAGLIHGKGGGEVAPEGLTTRAQSITVIERLLKLQDGEVLPKADKLTRSNAEFDWRRTNINTMLDDYLADSYHPYDESFMVESRDGLYKGELIRMTVIDLEDENDPNRSLVDINGLQWGPEPQYTTEYYNYYPLKDYKDSFLVVLNTKVHYVKDSKKYGTFNFVNMNNYYGDYSPQERDEMNRGILNGIPFLFSMDGEIQYQMVLLPKKVIESRNGVLRFGLSSSAIAPVGTTDIKIFEGVIEHR
ncbi:S-layer homology domain-containing protein [Paenibacillus sp. J5C_2022]|uniref:S-layer homology domain-containing protein n=1 Tax=Paenibacillus sp. J5C2022 TaxID=2977129 RepID=UPI0021CF6E3D|nr:S-layer homology domain-containing protein [Paenibacillus sp. J5C2022]MCU6712841.1 S-layer homology domain-containing protein [Paenibacillus sp. J5C2022]